MPRFIPKLQTALRLLRTDPVGFGQRLRTVVAAGLGTWRSQPRAATSGKIRRHGVVFRIDLDLDPVMESMYFGTYQAELVALMQRILRPGDSFIDVGANVGYVSAIALGLVGRGGQVHAFEPVPRYVERLRHLQHDNPRYGLHIHPIALADASGTATICLTNLPNIGWNTMVPRFMRRDTIQAEVAIPMTTFDQQFADQLPPRLRLIKIDTEGYELPVLQGMQHTLTQLAAPPVLIVEVAPAAYPKLGRSLADLAALVERLGYVAWDLAIAHPIDLTTLTKTTDIVLLPRGGSVATVGEG